MFKSLPRHMLWIIKMELSHLWVPKANIKTDGQENILTITLELFANLDLWFYIERRLNKSGCASTTLLRVNTKSCLIRNSIILYYFFCFFSAHRGRQWWFKTTLMHAHYYTLICNWCHFLNLIFCNVRFSHPNAPRMCVWGGGGGGGGGWDFHIYT